MSRNRAGERRAKGGDGSAAAKPGPRRAHGADAGASRSSAQDQSWVIAICCFLTVAVAAVYAQMGSHEFIIFDDNEYIFENPHITSGLSFANIRWAFTAFFSNNWHPVTWMSHMLDCQLFGLNAGQHHLMGAAFHLANTLLVFLLLRKLTGTLWQGAFVAAAFALHPMHVESVAWASERKDVLSTFFALLTIACYTAYAQRPTLLRYATFFLLFVLGIMAKPMLVTMPFVLMLLDYWPLHRFGDARAGALRVPKQSIGRLLVEKLPMLLVVIASSALTLAAQSKGGVVRSLEEVTVPMRLTNALVSWVRYAFKLLVPLQQAFYYPYPKTPPVVAAIGAALLLLAITWFVWNSRKERPWALVGWLWFVGTLVPVIGLVQVATQAIADRYAYIPSIGLFVIMAFGVAELSRRWPSRAAVLACTAAIVLGVYGTKAWTQTRYWKDSVTLFSHDAAIIPDNVLASRNLGVAYFRLGNYDSAIAAIKNVLRVYPHDEISIFDLATAYDRVGSLAEADSCYRVAIELVPSHVEARYNRGSLLNRMNRYEDAAAEFREAVRIRPDYFEAYNNLGNALGHLGKDDEAVAAYQKALSLNPNYVEAHNNMGTTLRKLQRNDEAIQEYETALRLNPSFPAAHYNLAIVEMTRGDSAKAMQHFDQAAALDAKLVNPMRPR